LLVRRNGGSIPVAGKNVATRSYNLDGENRCVDIFRRPEEYRREPEDGRGWFAIGDYSMRSFARESGAVVSFLACLGR